MSRGDAAYLSPAGSLSRGFLWLVTNLGYVATHPTASRRDGVTADMRSWELCRRNVRNQN